MLSRTTRFLAVAIPFTTMTVSLAAGAKPKSDPKTEQAGQGDSKAKPKGETKTESKTAQETEPKVEPKAEPKAETKDEAKAEPKGEPKGEPKATPGDEPGGGKDVAEKSYVVGLGFMGLVGASFVDKPTDISRQQNLYPGFGGGSSGWGLFIEGRYVEILGLEIDFIHSSDHGRGDITWNGAKYTVEIGQSAWHVPFLIKGNIPLPLITPCVFVGPEFVFPSDPSATSTPAYPAGLSASNSNYTLLTGGLGAELRLPIPKVNIRIPISFRASYNPSIPSSVFERWDYTAFGNPITNIKSNWKYHTQMTFGVSVYY